MSLRELAFHCSVARSSQQLLLCAHRSRTRSRRRCVLVRSRFTPAFADADTDRARNSRADVCRTALPFFVLVLFVVAAAYLPGNRRRRIVRPEGIAHNASAPLFHQSAAGFGGRSGALAVKVLPEIKTSPSTPRAAAQFRDVVVTRALVTGRPWEGEREYGGKKRKRENVSSRLARREARMGTPVPAPVCVEGQWESSRLRWLRVKTRAQSQL